MKSDFPFHYFNLLSSTNDKARYFIKKGESNLVILAKSQKKGRGRFNRTWNSQIGGLYMTILIKENDLDNARYLTFMASISVAITINKLGFKSKVKWPNDVLIGDKKLCGILTETVCNKKNYVMIGIGVNINQTKFIKNITNKTTSLKLESNKTYNINNISKIIIKEFYNLYNDYKYKNYNKIISIWKKHSYTLGKKVKVKTLSGNFIGMVIDVDKRCNLLLKLDNGKIKKIVEGDIFYV